MVCGIGGAYPSSGLNVGDVASAEIEIYGDLGAQSPSGFLDMQALGFLSSLHRLLFSTKYRCKCFQPTIA